MTSAFFQVGGRYRNRREAYEVSRIDGDSIIVRLDDGTTARYSSAMQERIVRNMAAEEARVLPSTLNEAQASDFAWTIGALSNCGRLEAEVPPKAWAGFSSTYERYSGERVSAEDPHVFLLSSDASKWGAELRIYIPSTVARNAKFVVPHEVSLVSGFKPGEDRINNNAFWWHLVERCGFRIGGPQDSAGVRVRLAPELQTEFDRGLHAI